ncbi:PX domain-containing protein kinase-like protein isoform X2 [Lineus longissimus]|uniref:PX domain-containing protein kinase-like protein isoform X2 n=1 Tax=Lineus longissimus TaxID=88925 RepID=UPI002B4E67D1
MAVFEKRKSIKLSLDDTVPLQCMIELAQNVKDHTEYVIRVQRGPLSENNWTVTKRYSDFVALDAILRVSGIDLPLPPKKVFGNMEREFIAERKTGLQVYLNTLVSNPFLAPTVEVKKFLDPRNYSVNLQEVALQHVSMYFRSEQGWEVVEPLPDFGWRVRKQYFMVRPPGQPKSLEVMHWTGFGPDQYIPVKELAAIMKILPTLQHPYICPISHAAATENGGMTIRPFREKGTLKDHIYKAKPKMPYLRKYGKQKANNTPQLLEIKTYGRHILEAVKFLQEKGVPYGHLHSGNVIIENGHCLLLDVENSLLGLPPIHRHHIANFKKIQTFESIDVFNFGHLLYEMAFGEPLTTATLDFLPPTCPPQLKDVLESILTPDSCKNGLPVITDLLANPLFSDVYLSPSEKPVLKIPSKLKEVLRSSKEETEKRLREDQKLISQVKRRSKAQAYHAEEEKKNRKKKRSSKKFHSTISETDGSSTTTTPPTSPTPSTPTSPMSPTSPDETS